MADNTWKFLEHQESNPEALKQAVDTLIRYTKKKGFAGAENAQLDSLELVKHVIICEAAALVLSDDWQAFMKYRKAGGNGNWTNRGNVNVNIGWRSALPPYARYRSAHGRPGSAGDKGSRPRALQ